MRPFRQMLAAGLVAFGAAPACAAELEGPGRFCGYSPIIDLLPGERVVTLEAGIHAGAFKWEGPWGAFRVVGVGWASRPRGHVEREQQGLLRFRQRRTHGKYVVALWNGSAGAAYFESPKPFAAAELDAIDRVRLFEEGQQPEGCKLRTIFSWD